MAGVSVKALSGSATFSTILLPDGTLAVAHVMVDTTGTPHSETNPFPTAPGLATVDFIPRSGAVTVAGAVALDIPANAARKGGWIRAAGTNQGTLAVTIVTTNGVTFTTVLGADETFTFTVNPGYVLPHEIRISGTTPGDTFEGVEFL